MQRQVLTNIRHTRRGSRAGAVLETNGIFKAILTQRLSDGRTTMKPLETECRRTANGLVNEWIRSGTIELNRKGDR